MNQIPEYKMYRVKSYRGQRIIARDAKDKWALDYAHGKVADELIHVVQEAERHGIVKGRIFKIAHLESGEVMAFVMRLTPVEIVDDCEYIGTVHGEPEFPVDQDARST